MAAITFDEYCEDNAIFGEYKTLYRHCWDAAIKSLEGVQTQTTNSTKPETVTPNHPCGLKGCASTSESISCEDCDQ